MLSPNRKVWTSLEPETISQKRRNSFERNKLDSSKVGFPSSRQNDDCVFVLVTIKIASSKLKVNLFNYGQSSESCQDFIFRFGNIFLIEMIVLESQKKVRWRERYDIILPGKGTTSMYLIVNKKKAPCRSQTSDLVSMGCAR